MRAATMESTRERMISIMARGITIMVLAISIGFFCAEGGSQEIYATTVITFE